ALRNAPVLAKVVTSVGIFVVLQEFVRLRFGETVKTGIQLPLPKGKVDLPGDLGAIPNNQLFLVAIVVIVGVGLWALFKYTRFGLATRAAAENEKGAIVLGFSPDFLAGANWVISTLIAGLLGVLASPITNLDTLTMPLLIVPALGAALLASFSSFGVTVAAGIGIAMLQGWVTYQGAQMFGLNYDWRQSAINTLVATVISLSLVVLVGFVGQISLAQMSIAGTAGFFLSKYFSDLPFPVGPIIGAVVAAGFGALIAIPALRVRGVNLAVITLAAAVAIEQLVFKNKTFAGETGALSVPPPKIGGKDFGPNNTNLRVFGIKAGDDIPPNVWFGVLCLIFAVVMCLMVVNVRRSATGRQFLAVRSN
ncbi:MAG: hypothetical protein EBX95_15190, partial [Acidimicrobiia bacterium]|nr:hypothetical protein [Acidimicrobiia bacterium]